MLVDKLGCVVCRGESSYGVVGLDASVNDVRASALTSTGVVGVASRATAAVGDSSKTPGSVGLSGVGFELHNGILLNEVDLVMASQHQMQGRCLVGDHLHWGRHVEPRGCPCRSWRRSP